MIIANGNIESITVTPADLQADPPTVEMADVLIQMSPPEGAGLCHILVPNAAMGGLAAGPARVMIESA